MGNSNNFNNELNYSVCVMKVLMARNLELSVRQADLQLELRKTFKSFLNMS
jgi:hypothetical protein